MKKIILMLALFAPLVLLAQFPSSGNKSRLGWQTTSDGLIWRGVAGDTVNKPNNRNYPYFQLDTVNSVLYRYIQTRGQWQPVSENIDIDSLIYATRFWVNSNFFPLQGGLLTGTGGAGYVGFPLQSSPPATPATGFSLFAGSTGNNISWMQPDGFFRRLVSPVTGVARQYQFMARSYTLGDSADIANNVTSIAANYIATSNGTNLVARNLFDNDTYVGILNNKPFSLGQWTTAGRPTGVNGYTGFNTSTNWLDIYSSSGWFSPLQSSQTGGIGSASNLFYGDANGRATNIAISPSSSVLKWYINTSEYSTSGPALEFSDYFGSNKYGIYVDNGGNFRIDRINTSTTVGLTINSLNQVTLDVVNITADGSVFVPSVALSLATNQETGIYQPGTDKLAFSTARRDRIKIATTGVSIAPSTIASGGTVADAARALDNFGDMRIRDLITDNPTKLIGADADGDINEAKLGSGLSFSGDTLKLLGNGKSIYNQLPLTSVYLTPTAQRTLSFKRTRLSVSTDIYDSTGVGKIIIQPDTTNNLSVFGIVNTEMSQSLLQFGGGRSIAFRGQSYTGRKDFWDIERVNLINSSLIPLYAEVGAAQSISIGASKIDFIGDLMNTTLSRIRFQTGNLSSRYSQPLTLYENGTAAIGWGNPAYHGRKLGIPGYLPLTFPDGGLVIGDTCRVCEDLSKVTFIHDPNDSTYIKDKVRLASYGTGTKEAADLSKTQSNYIAGFATDGTVLDLERKRDTTIYIDDADYDWSAAITTAQIASRFNRVIFWMTTTAAAGSDSELTLHTPDANLMQVEYLIHSVDEPAGFDNKIVFGTNNAVDSTNGLVTNYYPAAGDGIHIRAGLRSGVYKYRYSN